jgi:glucose/arabinose dehydrogenase
LVRWGVSLVVASATLLACIAAGTAPAETSSGAPIGAAAAIRVVPVATLDNPVGFTFTPRGRIVYLERFSGRVRLLNRKTGADHELFHISGVNGDGERGALGVALHPDWPRQPFVYVYVTRAPGAAPLRNQLLRLRLANGHLTGMRVLLNSPISDRTNHNGGRIAFGPDGKLYIVIGDGGDDPGRAQDLAEVRGKVLRLNPNGSVPATNPFGSRVWSYGHRNSIGFAFDPQTGNLWETENGPECNDEINLIEKGGNFAWGPSEACGSPAAPQDTNQDGPMPRIFPQHAFAQTIAITGAAFCDGCGLGAVYAGDLLFGCANGTCKTTVGPIGHVDLLMDRSGLAGGPAKIPTSYAGPIYSMEVGPGGRLYVSDQQGIYRLTRA